MKRLIAALLVSCLLVPPCVFSAAASAADADRAADRAAWRVTPDDLLPNSEYWVQNWNGEGSRGLHTEATDSGTAVYIGADSTATLGWCLSRPVALDGLHLYLRDLSFDSDCPLFTVTFDAEGVREVNRGEDTLRFDLDAGSLLLGETILIAPGNTVIRSMGAGQDTFLAIAKQDELLRLTLTTPAGTATADFAPPACAASAYLNFSTYYTEGVLTFELMGVHGGNEPCIPMTPDYDAVRYAVGTDDFNNHNWWGERLKRTDLPDGGLRVRIQSDATGHIGVLYGQSVSVDGLCLNFGRLQGGGDNSNLCLLLGDEPGKGFDNGNNLLLVLNFTKGTLYAYPPAGGATLIPENDFIKNLADGKTPFRISVKLQRDGDYLVTVDTLRDRVEGVLPAKYLGDTVTASPEATQLFLSCHGSNDVLEFDLLSLRHGDMRDFGTATRLLYDAYTNNAAYAARVREGIDKLGKVTLTSGDAIASLEAAYAALYDPSPVSNYASLVSARRTYDELYAQAVDAAEPAQYAFKIPVTAREFSAFNAGFSVTDVNGGVHIGCENDAKWSGRTVCEAKMSVDGLRIELAGQDSLRAGALAVALVRDPSQWASDDMMILLFEPVGGNGNGLLRLLYCRKTGQEVRAVAFDRDIWSDDSLVIELYPVGDGDSVVLLVNGQNMTTLSKSKDLGLADEAACHVAFGYWSNTNGDAAVTLTDLSCRDDFVRIAAVDKAIAAIGEVTRDAGDAIAAAEAAYKALPARLKRRVSAQETLVEAIAAYELLLTGTTGTTPPIDDPTTATTAAPSTQPLPPVTGTTGTSVTAGTTASQAPTATTAPTTAADNSSAAVGDAGVPLRTVAIAVGALALMAACAAVLVVLRQRKR